MIRLLQVIQVIMEWGILSYFTLTTIYLLFFSIAGLFRLKKNSRVIEKFQRIAVLIPAYKEDTIIVETAKDALEQKYPKSYFEVFIIADSFQEETLKELANLPVKLIIVSFEESTKAKALNWAMNRIDQPFDIAVILDADNLMDSNFLSLINATCTSSNPIVQGHRIAKNMNTNFAILDAISEEINNHIFRKGHRIIGLSSALIGSGMAFRFNFFKQIMSSNSAVGGFDKELEIKILHKGYKIDYMNDAIVYDEKVQEPKVFANQRRRWLAVQLIYFQRFWFTALKELIVKRNIDLFDKVYQMILPPRVLHIGITTFAFGIYLLLHLVYFGNSFLNVHTYCWGTIWGLSTAALAISIPSKFYNLKTIKAASSLPKAFFIMLFSLFKLKGANNSFIHTTHGTKLS